MSRPRVLYISHDHPQVHVGGAEIYTFELFQAMRRSGEFDPVLLARATSPGYRRSGGSPFRVVNDDDVNQVFWIPGDFDGFFMTLLDKKHYTLHFHRFLRSYRPDLVHIQHTSGLGFDLIRQIRNSLPGVPIVYTLHEFMPICHARGLMKRTIGGELCDRATPMRCHECFPKVSPQKFFLRERFIKSHLEQVDLFISPSRFLLGRYGEWGVPEEKLRFLENGRNPQSPGPDAEAPPPIGHIGFFAQMAPHKGVVVLLRAMKLLVAQGETGVHLFLHGANFEDQDNDFRKEVDQLLKECGDHVTFLGKYKTAEIPRLMENIAWVVVPSIWWENAPMVIQEAFMNGRPVICSDIGGMKEKVNDGIDGLHFRVGNAVDLAATLRRAIKSPDLWRRLSAGIEPVFSIEDAVRAHSDIYRSLIGNEGVRGAAT